MIASPILTSAGLFLFYNEKEVPVTMSGNGSRASYSFRRTIGGIAGGLGIFTTLTGVPLLVLANHTKKEAKLIFSNQVTSFSRERFTLPNVAMQINF